MWRFEVNEFRLFVRRKPWFEQIFITKAVPVIHLTACIVHLPDVVRTGTAITT